MQERLGDLSICDKNLWLGLVVDLVVTLYYFPRM